MPSVPHSGQMVTMMYPDGHAFETFGPQGWTFEAYRRVDGSYVVDVPVEFIHDARSHHLVAAPPLEVKEMGVAALSSDAKADIAEAVEAEGTKSEKAELSDALAEDKPAFRREADPEGTPHPEESHEGKEWDGLTGDHLPPEKRAVKKK